MRSGCVLTVLAILSTTALSTELKQRIQKVPMPMPRFSSDRILGLWFVQFRKTPCTWPGSSKFTDYTSDFRRQGGSFHSVDIWRKQEFCTKSVTQYFPRGPAVFTAKDGTGDNWSGSMIVTATDYKAFLILWGCTKMSALGIKCDDPWLSISTRQSHPGPRVVATIKNLLRNTFGVRISELQRVIHGRPCMQAGGMPKKMG